MLAKIEFFEVYRVLWVLEFVDTDLEDHHLQIKYFTSIQAPECVSALPAVWPELRRGGSAFGGSAFGSRPVRSSARVSLFSDKLTCKFEAPSGWRDCSLQLNKEGNLGFS